LSLMDCIDGTGWNCRKAKKKLGLLDCSWSLALDEILILSRVPSA
jgi:hypothetical protein